MAVGTGNLGRDRLGRYGVAVEDRDLRTERGESTTSRGANPAAAAGNEGDFSGEILRHFFNSLVSVSD